ncbi:MAG: ABC transporter permease, partial [Acidobacteria bacterium]|nr:ABC transporter permease [Acidobacteriota bacterium]
MKYQLLWLVIKKEYLLNLISLRSAIAFLLATTLTILSVFLLIEDYRSRSKEYSQRSASHFEELASAYSYEGLLDDEVVVDKEPARLSIFAQGIERNIDPVVKFRKGEYPVLNESFSENPLFSLFRRIDFLFIVQYIMSLMALFFAYDNISGEKETGTFKLLFSYAVPRDVVILGKVIGGFTCLITPLTFAFLASLMLIVLKGVGFSAADY